MVLKNEELNHFGRGAAFRHSSLFGVSRRPIFKLLLIKETAMDSGAVSVHFDSGHLFLDLSDGQAVEFPLGWFPALQAATTAERGCFAISLDRQQLYWPELHEEMDVTALLQSLPDRTRH
ncbi:DUF2442 domain-containing protein [Paraburkholderia dipogonis]|jgi:hypothetical protein|uniref:DUF2442 domain-containing protein n=1 Tax=Paraburkholderia dipogonis TaxID=1211383 RepID=A0ABW9B8A7_9BURK